jgi:hypothetical protein
MPQGRIANHPDFQGFSATQIGSAKANTFVLARSVGRSYTGNDNLTAAEQSKIDRDSARAEQGDGAGDGSHQQDGKPVGEEVVRGGGDPGESYRTICERQCGAGERSKEPHQEKRATPYQDETDGQDDPVRSGVIRQIQRSLSDACESSRRSQDQQPDSRPTTWKGGD